MIKNIYKNNEFVLSFEVFPPKRDDDLEAIYNSLEDFKQLSPDYISVTYGAGGNTAAKTGEIACYIQNQCGIPALAHLTCVALTEEKLYNTLEDLKSKNINNILALRGDKPKDMDYESFCNRTYKNATDIIPIIKKYYDVSIAGAAYPEKHLDAPSLDFDLDMLKLKEEKGADFFITQLFFDNDVFYDYINKVCSKNIKAPISVGIMPITSLTQVSKTISLSGASLPNKFKVLMHKYIDNPDDMKKAGLEYAINQINELIHWGIQGLHLYTMNNVEVTKAIISQININK